MANNRNRRYLARDFESFKNELLTYARRYYPNQIQDFSDASVGGLFLDMASYVGDNLSFYLDHLYGELNPETAVENLSIERALINSGNFFPFFKLNIARDCGYPSEFTLLTTIISEFCIKEKQKFNKSSACIFFSPVNSKILRIRNK